MPPSRAAYGPAAAAAVSCRTLASRTSTARRSAAAGPRRRTGTATVAQTGQRVPVGHLPVAGALPPRLAHLEHRVQGARAGIARLGPELQGLDVEPTVEGVRGGMIAALSQQFRPLPDRLDALDAQRSQRTRLGDLPTDVQARLGVVEMTDLALDRSERPRAASKADSPVRSGAASV